MLFGFYIVIYLKYLDFNFCNDLNGKSNYLYFFQCYLQFSYHKIIHSHRIKIPFLLNTITKHRFGSDFITSVSQSVSSVTQSCLTFCDPMNRSTPASLSITNFRSLPKPISIESVMPSNHLILCRPLLLLPSIFPSIRVFSNESALSIKWPKYWSFSFNISLSNEHQD